MWIMEPKQPAWLDACFVQNVLRKAEKDESIEVSSIIVKPATAKGDNYASEVHRVTVELSRIQNGDNITETISVIVKVPLPVDNYFRDAVLDAGFFETEMSMMVEILPIMNRIMADLSMTSLAPRCLQVQYEDPMHLMMEDLVPRGFRMAERGVGLDLDHSLLVMRNIAAFHAASVALAEKDSNVKKYVAWNEKEHEKIETLVALNASFLSKSTRAVGIEVANWPDLSPRISEKILNLSDVIQKRDHEAARFLQDDFNVLNHGDCSMNNMLFRYNEQQKPIEQIFVDFQFSRYGSPACDILFFFGSSSSVEVRLDNRDLLLREYYDALTSIMAKLKCSTKPPSFEDLKDILRKRAFCEVLPSFITLTLVLVDRNEVKDLGAMVMSDEKSDRTLYKGKMYRKVMTKALPFYDSMGLLDL